ncbi:hypothetical protein RIF29_48425 [Crotalaria pallida]|uniref:Maturase n=1 Tax=Crotalaria pallida TaxID=3830 RepID=A0AAN9HM58_CROPI
MSGNVHVRLREKGGGQKWPCCTSLSSSMGSALFFLGEYANMILMRCGALHLTFVGLPSSGACVPAFLCNKPLRPKTSEGSKFRPLTVVLPIEKIMKEAIRMVLESIYDPEFPDTSHFRSGGGRYSALRRIKEEWGTSRWFLEFDIRKCFHTIDRHRLIPIFKEEIDDPKFFYSIHQVFSAGRLVGGEKGPYSVPHSVLLSALPGNIYLHKLDQEIGRIRQKYEIPRIRSVLLRTGRIDDQENSGEEASFNAPQDNRAIIVGRVKSIQRKAAFHSLVSSWHTPPTSTPRRRGDQKTPFVFPPSSALAAFLNKPSSLLCAAFFIEAAGLTPKAEFYGRQCFNNNLAMRDLIKYCKRKGLLIELGGEARLVIRASHRNTKTYRPLPTIRPEPLVPPRTTPIKFLRELEKRLRVKHRIHITVCHLRSAIHSKFRNLGKSIPIKQLTKGMSETGSLLDGVPLVETLGTAGVRSPQTLAEFPNSIELGKLGPGQDPNNKEHSTTSLGVIPPPIRPDERSTELHPYSPGPCTSLSPGGWPPILDLPIFKRIPGSIWFSIKVILFLFLYIWVRAAFPRYRYDQLMGLGRKVFLPLSLARVVAVSGVSVTFPWLP